MHEAALRSSILRVLGHWGSLPETDLIRRLPPEQAAEFGLPVLQSLADSGLVVVREVGDERVIKLTDQGRAQVRPSQPL